MLRRGDDLHVHYSNYGNRPAYRRAAVELKLVQEALGPIFARSKADELRSKYPSRSALHAEIRDALEG